MTFYRPATRPLLLPVARARPLALARPEAAPGPPRGTPEPLPALVPAWGPLPLAAGVENCEAAVEALAEEVGGFSTKEVSVVLQKVSVGLFVSLYCSSQECMISVGARLGIDRLIEGCVFSRLVEVRIISGSAERFWHGRLEGCVRWRSLVSIEGGGGGGGRQTSGKSTQKALTFMPCKKLAKHSLNLDKLSCSNCKCIKLASRSAIPSASSAKAGSSGSSGEASMPPLRVGVCDERSELLEGGRNGVVGRGGGEEKRFCESLKLVGVVVDIFSDLISSLVFCNVHVHAAQERDAQRAERGRPWHPQTHRLSSSPPSSSLSSSSSDFF